MLIYENMNTGHFHELVSRLTVAKVDMHWQHRAKNTIRPTAVHAVIRGLPSGQVASCIACCKAFGSLSDSPPKLKIIPSEGTTVSRAGNAERIAVVILQSKPAGLNTGSIVLPNRPKAE